MIELLQITADPAFARRWPRMPHEGFLLVFIASRATLTTAHQQLASEVESLLAHAGALKPVTET